MAQADRKSISLAKLAVLLACVTPVTVLASVIATRTGVIDLATGLGFIGLKVGPVLAWIGAVVALGSLLLLLRTRSVWPYALAAVVIAGVTLGIYQYQLSRTGIAPRDVASDVEEPPVFGRKMLSERRSVGTRPSTAQQCEGLVSIDSQMAPEVVAWAMKQSGVTVMGVSPFRVDGWKEGMWYGIQHDVTVRIRPGRTDIRVAGRDNMPIGPRACDLAKELVAEINALR